MAEITKTPVEGIGGAVATAAALPSISEVAAQLQAEAKPEVATEKGVAPAADVATEVVESAESAEAPAAETPVVPAPAPEKKDSSSSRFAALSKKEKAIREATARQEADKRALEARVAEQERKLQERLKEVEEREARIKGAKRPTDLLKAAGWSYQDATEDVLGNYKPKEPDPIEERLSPVQEQMLKIAKENEELRKSVEAMRQETQAKEAEQQYRQFVDAVKKTLSNGLEKYELTASLGDDAIDIVRETMVEYYRRNGTTPDYEQACDMVEDYLEKKYVDPFAKTKKFQSRFNKTDSTPPPAAKPAAAKSSGKPTPKTLSVDHGAAGTATDDIDKMGKHDALAYLAKKYG